MARLPNPGGDDSVWGDILNDYLKVSHEADGSLKPGVVDGNTIQNGSVGDTQISSISQSKVNGLTAALSGKANSAVTVTGTNSLTGGGDLTANRTMSLVNDTATPGNSKYYGTNGAGTKGFHDIPVSEVLDSANYIISRNGSTYVATSSVDGTQLASGPDAAAVLTAAISALGTGGGTIAFKPGIYTWSTVPALPANLTGWLHILGQRAVISLTTAGPRFLDFDKQADGDTFRNLHIEGFTVDAAALAAVGGTQHIIIGTYRPNDGVTSGINVNFEYLVLKNLRSLNVRVASSGVAHHLNIFIGVHQNAAGLPENHIEHVVIEDCDMDGGNHGVTVYGNKSGAWSGNPTIRLDDIVIRHIRHDMRSTPTGFDATSHVHISSLAYGNNVIIEDVWGYGSRDVGVEVDAMMNARVANIVIENYYGFALALTNYNNPGEYRAQHVYARDVVGVRNAGIASPSSSSVVGIRTTPGLPNGHFTFENIKHYRSAGADDLSTSPIAGDLLSVKGSIESLMLDGGHYEAVGAVLSGSSGVAAQIVYADDLTSVRTRFSINNLDVRFRGAKAVGATAGIALSAIQLNSDVDFDITNVRLFVDFPNIEQVTGVDLGSASGGTIRGKVDAVKVFGPNLGSNPKGVFIPSSSSVTIPYSGAVRVRNIDPDALPAGAAIFVGDATNKALVDIGAQPLSAAGKTVTADYTATSSDGIIFVNSAGNVTISLPSGTTSGAGKEFVVKPIGSGTTFVNALGGNVDGLGQITLSSATTFASDGVDWYSVSPTLSAPNLPVSFFARTVTANTSLTAADGIVFSNGTNITVTLPSGTTSGAGKQFTVKNINSTSAFVNAAGGNVNGAGQMTILPGHSVNFASDGTNWIVMQELGGEPLQTAAKTITANYQINPVDGSIFVNGAGITVTLPSATDMGGGRKFMLKNIGGSSADVNAAGGNVEGVGQVALPAGSASTFTSDGTNWWVG